MSGSSTSPSRTSTIPFSNSSSTGLEMFTVTTQVAPWGFPVLWTTSLISEVRSTIASYPISCMAMVMDTSRSRWPWLCPSMPIWLWVNSLLLGIYTTQHMTTLFWSFILYCMARFPCKYSSGWSPKHRCMRKGRIISKNEIIGQDWRPMILNRTVAFFFLLFCENMMDDLFFILSLQHCLNCDMVCYLIRSSSAQKHTNNKRKKNGCNDEFHRCEAGMDPIGKKKWPYPQIESRWMADINNLQVDRLPTKESLSFQLLNRRLWWTS